MQKVDHSERHENFGPEAGQGTREQMPILWETFIGNFGYWTKVCFSVLASPGNHYGTQSVLAHSVWWLWDIVLGIIEDHTLLAAFVFVGSQHGAQTRISLSLLIHTPQGQDTSPLLSEVV